MDCVNGDPHAQLLGSHCIVQLIGHERKGDDRDSVVGRLEQRVDASVREEYPDQVGP